MKGKIKVVAAARIFHRDRLIKKVGVDTDVMIALIDDVDQFSMFKPKIYSRNNFLHINYIVFSELMGHFMYNRKLSQNQARDKIFLYLRENGIKLLKKSDTDLKRAQEIFGSLDKQRKALDNKAGDKDLKIISIYKLHEIDLIYSRNSDDFEPFCRYLGISFEKLQDNMDVMWKRAFGYRKKRR